MQSEKHQEMKTSMIKPGSQIVAGIVRKTVDAVNGINQYFFILLILLLYFFRFRLSINEEHYFQLSRAYWDPSWIPNSFTLTEFASTRVLFQLITGFFLQYFSFEVVAAMGQLFWSIAISFALLKLYRLLGLSNIFILLHLPILYFWDSFYSQAFFALEWLFHGMEPKVFAYFFVMFALYFLLTERYYLASIFLAAATCFHLLVGGWVMVYFSLYHLLKNRSIKKTFFFGLAYLACLIPFIIYLIPSFTHAFSPAGLPVHPDWIYTYFRQPYHTALFLDIPFFIAQHGEGVLEALAFFILCLFVFSRFGDELNRKVNLLNILMFSGLFLCVFLAYFDRNGSFVKYFPFRICGLLTFLVFLQLVYLADRYVLRDEVRYLVQFGILAYFLVAITPIELGSVAKDFYNFYKAKSHPTSLDKATAFIRENTERDAVFLLMPERSVPDDYFSFDMNHSFMRKAQRDRFVAFEFAPVSPEGEKVYEWYQRLLAKNEIVKDLGKVCEVREKYRIDYLLADFEVKNIPCLRPVYAAEGYFIYRIADGGE